MNARTAPPPISDDGLALMAVLAHAHMDQGRPEKAAVLLAALDALGGADARQRTALALAQLRSGKPEAALATLERIALAGRLDAAFHLVRAQALQRLDRHDEAQAAMRAYIAARPAPALDALTGPSSS